MSTLLPACLFTRLSYARCLHGMPPINIAAARHGRESGRWRMIKLPCQSRVAHYLRDESARFRLFASRRSKFHESSLPSSYLVGLSIEPVAEHNRVFDILVHGRRIQKVPSCTALFVRHPHRAAPRRALHEDYLLIFSLAIYSTSHIRSFAAILKLAESAWTFVYLATADKTAGNLSRFPNVR